MKSNITARVAGTVIVCSLISLVMSCMPRDEEIRRKDTSRSNPTTAFIYNAIPQNESATITPEYSTAINSFAVNLLHALCTSDALVNKNLIISPLNINRNLAIITEAAEGETKQELLNTLGGQRALDDAQNALAELLYADNSVILQIADAIWINSARYELIPSFVSLAESKYGVRTAALDFSNTDNTVSTINNWVEQNTAHNIRNMINDRYIKPLTACFITSAIYFKADWESPFDISKTSSQPFAAPDGSVSVDMMVSESHFQTISTGEYQNAKMYYGTRGRDYFFLDIYMPVTQSVPDFIRQHCPDLLEGGDSIEYRSVHLPKFMFENKLDLQPALESIGLKLPFDPLKSQLTGLASFKDTGLPVELYIDTIVHCAGIRTDEEGTEAYAVTVTGGTECSAGSVFENIVFDRPFVYFVRAGKNGLVLFAGIMYNPGKSS